MKLKHFSKFGDMTEALSAATAAIEGKMSKSLKKVLKKVFASDAHEQLAVADAKLGSVIKVIQYMCMYTVKFTLTCTSSIIPLFHIFPHNISVNKYVQCTLYNVTMM